MSRIKTGFISIISMVLTIGFITPSQAASITSPSVTSNGLTAGSKNSSQIVVKATVTTGGVSDRIAIDLPSDWSFVSNGTCSFIPVYTIAGFTMSTAGNGCFTYNGGPTVTDGRNELIIIANATLAAGTEVTVTFPINNVNVRSGQDFDISFVSKPGASYVVNDTSTVTLSASTPDPTPAASTPASATPTNGTAAALAELPKKDKRTKISFASGDNGLTKSSKKTLAHLVDVAEAQKFGIRITAEAGAQTGVDRDVIKALARKRAKEIRAYLVKQGCDANDIEIKTKVVSEGTKPNTSVKLVVID